MKDIKQIKFVNEPSSFSCEDPTIVILINEQMTTYQAFYKTQFDMFIKDEESYYPGPLWETKTHSIYFSKLKDVIEEIFEADTRVLDSFGTIVTIEYSDGTIKEKYIEDSFYHNSLDKIANIIKKLIIGIKLPPFLIEKQEVKEEDI